MLSSITRNWWLVALRGTLAVIFGLAALVWPGMTLEILVLLFGAYAFIDGVFRLTFGLFTSSGHEHWWPLVLGGILGIALGAITLAQPTAMALVLVYVVGAWALITGLLEIVAAIRLREVIANEWLMGFGGALSVVFGILVVAQPGPSALIVVSLFGFYAILNGISQIGLGFRLRGPGRSVQHGSGAAPSPAR
jgi:uncharacterized membrane protein HdeD (DUF308 family)